MDVTVPLTFSVEGTTVGRDTAITPPRPSTDRCLPFTGKVRKVAVDRSGEAGRDDDGDDRRARQHLRTLVEAV